MENNQPFNLQIVQTKVITDYIYADFVILNGVFKTQVFKKEMGTENTFSLAKEYEGDQLETAAKEFGPKE